MKTKLIITLGCYLLLLLFNACNFSDYTEDLGNDYFIRKEGGDLTDILCKRAKGGEIPATVVDYNYNSYCIIAKQNPKLPQEPLYNRTYKYDRGDKEFYYWLIIKKGDRVIGPLSYQEFSKLKLALTFKNKS